MDRAQAPDGPVRPNTTQVIRTAFVLALLGVAGGGTFALKHADASPNERLAVVETKLELLARRVEKMDASGEDTNRMVRLLSVARGINPDAKER